MRPLTKICLTCTTDFGDLRLARIDNAGPDTFGPLIAAASAANRFAYLGIATPETADRRINILLAKLEADRKRHAHLNSSRA